MKASSNTGFYFDSANDSGPLLSYTMEFTVYSLCLWIRGITVYHHLLSFLDHPKTVELFTTVAHGRLNFTYG